MRISDWSSDVCSSDLPDPIARQPWQMLIPLFMLVSFGAAVLYSAAGGSMEPFAASHLLRFTLFLVMASFISLFPRELIKLLAYPAYIGVLVLLLAVEAIGAIGGGSQRWLNPGPLVLQPSALMRTEGRRVGKECVRTGR